MFNKDTLSTPPQKKSTREKYKDGQQWFKDCADSYEYQAIYYEQEIHRKMEVLFDLDDNKINQEEIEKVFNPLGLSNATFPSGLKHYPIAVPKIDLLVGEESKRRFDWTVRSTNPGQEASNITKLLDMFMEIAIEEFKKESTDEKQLEAKIQEYSRFLKFKYKDLNEITATKIIKYLYRKNVLNLEFNYGFRNGIVGKREMYRIDIEGNEPVLKKVDPRNVYLIKKGDSFKIEDSEAIVEITYESIGKIIDAYYEYLSPAEIDTLENGQWRTSAGKGNNNLNYSHNLPPIYSNLDFGNGEGFIDIREFNNNHFQLGLPYDYEGNVRVVRIRWVGRKKIGVVTYYDENTGDESEKIVSEYYKINADLGETVKWLWVNEAYEVTKIADSIYIKMQPRPVQMRAYDNKSKCFLGYVGSDYGISLMERMEPYQYLYNIYMNKLEMIFNKYKGPIYELDVSKIPDDWEMDMWLYYADMMGWAVIDPMNEGKKGAATGKLAGSFNTTGKVLDPRVGDYIQQTIGMLTYIEKQIGVISGVSEQRQGQVENRETVGGVERSVTQSSHITEKWFLLHEETKKRALAALLDTAKQLWSKNDSVVLSYIMDDMSRDFIKFNGEDFALTEQDLFISNSNKDAEIREVVKQLAQPMVQNGMGSVVLDLLNTDSIAEMVLTLKDYENRMLQMQQESSAREQEVKQAELAAEAKKNQDELDFKYHELEVKTQLEYDKLTGQSSQPVDTTAERKLSIEEKRLAVDEAINNRKLSETERHNREAERISKQSKNSK